MPHLPGEQIRQVKMIPCSMWRQRAEETSREECSFTVSSAEGVRAEELKKLPHLPEETSREECSLHSQLSRRSLS
ncbi:hypothetical protein ACFX2G_033347 [Malus domestica]